MNIYVGHLKIHKGYYAGRPNSSLGNPASYKPNKFATVICSTKQECLEYYDSWLQTQLLNKNSPQSVELDLLIEHLKLNQDLTLLCWCVKDKRLFIENPYCHCDIIAKYIMQSINAI